MRPPPPRLAHVAEPWTHFWDLTRGPCLHLWRLIHCVMRTAGNGVTFAEGREDNAVTPDQSRSEQNQTLSGRLSISFLLHNTADTLYPSSSAFSPTSISRDVLLHEEVLGTAWRIDLAGSLSYVSPPWSRLGSASALVWRTHSSAASMYYGSCRND